MAETNIYDVDNTLINRGLSMREINNQLVKLFQDYSMVLNRIIGNELIGNSQIREFYSDNNVYKEYSKGQITIKNGIDKLKYLLDHREQIANLIGIDSKTINDNKRNLAKVKEYIKRLQSVCEIGDVQYPTQIYISKHDGNIGSLDLSSDWVDYILCQSWIDKLANKSIGKEYSPSDYRIEYLSDMIHGLMTDHEIKYHKNLDEFNPDNFLDKKVDELDLKDAMNKLNSFRKLNYGFYELFKPIGNQNGKYIKVKMSTDGYVDISGVVSLNDCDNWPWEYGSSAYLRSLNTGNQRYLFQLDIPINSKNSVLWWSPDNEERLNPQPPYDEQGNPKPTVRYFKEYEVERFLRWFGNDHIPRIDETTLEKCTACSSPNLSNDTESDTFYSDARNIGEMDLTRMNIDNSTSQSLLSLYPKATIALRTYFHDDDADDYREPMDGDDANKIHQYIEFVVTGNRQTSNVSFNVRGKIESVLQEKHHYIHTLKTMQNELESLFNNILFLQVSEIIAPEIVTVWNNLVPDFTSNEPWTPENWIYLEDKLKELLKSPNVVDVLRFRQLDFDTIFKNDEEQRIRRKDEFLKELDADPTKFIYKYCKGDQENKKLMLSLIKNKQFFDKNGDKQGILQGLYDYIFGFKAAMSQDDLAEAYNRINLPFDSQRQNLVVKPLVEMYGDPDERTQPDEDDFSDVTVDMLRERITTFNNLIVRLPVNSAHNCLTSKHIFQDWKAFVDGAKNYLIQNNNLFESSDDISELGTDGKEHTYKELYIDENRTIPLVDYSYIQIDQETELPSADRWDYWTEEDFKWPQ